MSLYDLGLSTADPVKYMENVFKTINRRLDQLERRTYPASTAWTSFVPALWQGQAVSSTQEYSRYLKMGRLVVGNARTMITSPGAGPNHVLTANMPVSSASNQYNVIGSGFLQRSNVATNYPFLVSMFASDRFAFIPASFEGSGFYASTSGGTAVALNDAVAAGDYLLYSFMYESAS